MDLLTLRHLPVPGCTNQIRPLLPINYAYPLAHLPHQPPSASISDRLHDIPVALQTVAGTWGVNGGKTGQWLLIQGQNSPNPLPTGSPQCYRKCYFAAGKQRNQYGADCYWRPNHDVAVSTFAGFASNLRRDSPHFGGQKESLLVYSFAFHLQRDSPHFGGQ